MKLKVAAIVIICLVIFTGCASNISEKVSERDVSFSKSMVENMLIAENNDDYNKFTQYFSSKMKKSFTKQSMESEYKLVNSKIGQYIPGSKKFKEAMRVSQNNEKYIIVIYDVKYKNEPGETTVTTTFSDNSQHELEGIYISSPKLRAK